MHTTTIPSYLKTIQDILQLAFPNGVRSSFYFPLLTILEPEISDRNLAQIIVNVTNKDYSLVLNDIYRVKSNPFDDPELIQSVRSLLDAHGYQTWLEHD